MEKKEVKDFLNREVKKRMQLLGIESGSIGNDTDLVQEGIYDSLSFVDLINDCESHFNVLIDLEKYEAREFTRLGRLIEIIMEAPAS